MKTGSALWAASCALMSIQMTVAQAAPAPPEGQRDLRPRYYFPRHVKRQLFSNDTLIGVVGGALDNLAGQSSSEAPPAPSSPAPASPSPEPSPAASPTTPAAAATTPSAAGAVAASTGSPPPTVPSASAEASPTGAVAAAAAVEPSPTSAEAPISQSIASSDVGTISASLPATSQGLVAGLVGDVTSVLSDVNTVVSSVVVQVTSVVQSVVSDVLPTGVLPSSSLIDPAVLSSVVSIVTNTGGVAEVLPLPTTSADLVSAVNSIVSQEVGTLVGLSTIISADVPLTSAVESLVSSIVAPVPSAISSVVASLPLTGALPLPTSEVVSIISEVAPTLPVASVVSSVVSEVVPTLPVASVVSSVVSEVVPTLPVSSIVSEVIPPPTAAVSSIVSEAAPTLPVSSIVSEVLPTGAVSSIVSEIQPTLPVTSAVAPTGVSVSLPLTEATVVPLPTTAESVAIPTSGAATLPVSESIVAPTSLPPLSGTAISESIVAPEPTTSGIQVPLLSSVTDVVAPTVTRDPSSPAPFSIVPTGTDTATVQSIATGIIIQPSLPGQTQTTTATGIPTSMPKVISPAGGVPTKPTNTTLVQVGFQHELNYAFVSGNPSSAAQIFSYLPDGILYGLGLDDGIRMQSLQPYDMSKTQGWIMTLALFYVPSEMVNQLAVDIHTPNADLYNNPNPTVATLMNLIVPSIPLLAGQPMDGTTPADGTQQQAATVSPGAAGGGAPFGGDASNGSPVSKSAAAIAAPIATGGLLYGAAMVFVARRYRKRRQRHQRTSSVTGGSERMTNARNSQGSGSTNGRSIRTQQISAPVMAENSLGWN